MPYVTRMLIVGAGMISTPHVKFHPISAEIGVWEPKRKYYKNVEIYMPYKDVCYAQFLQNFQSLWALPSQSFKYGWIRSRGSNVMEV